LKKQPFLEKVDSYTNREIKPEGLLNKQEIRGLPNQEYLGNPGAQLISSNHEGSQPGVNNVATKLKPVKQKSTKVKSTSIEPILLETSRSGVLRLEAALAKPRYPETFEPSFKSSRNLREEELSDEKGPSDIESNLKLFQKQYSKRSPDKQDYGYERKLHIEQFPLMQHNFDENKTNRESNLTSSSNKIVPGILENIAVVDTEQLKNTGPFKTSGSVSVTKTQAEVEQPVIRVNIGRIEVKAITPMSPTLKRENKLQAPKLSIDEYLNSRNGGKV